MPHRSDYAARHVADISPDYMPVAGQFDRRPADDSGEPVIEELQSRLIGTSPSRSHQSLAVLKSQAGNGDEVGVDQKVAHPVAETRLFSGIILDRDRPAGKTALRRTDPDLAFRIRPSSNQHRIPRFHNRDHMKHRGTRGRRRAGPAVRTIWGYEVDLSGVGLEPVVAV